MESKFYKYLIIGGGVAGTTAAETIRRNDSSGSIAIVNEDLYSFYSKILLSKPGYFLEKIPEEKVFLRTLDWYREQKINLLSERKAVVLNPRSQTVDLDSGEKVRYEKLLLATGSCPRKWTAKGAKKEGVFYLRTLDDYKKIKTALKSAKCVVIIGSGFISFEMCDVLRQAGYEVNAVMLKPYFNGSVLDETAGRLIDEALRRGGIELYHNSEAAEVTGKNKVEGVVLKNGAKIACEAIICGIGTICQLDCVKEAGISVNRGILVNEYLETTVPNIWAAGDVAEFNDVVLREQVQMSNWLNAQTQGKIAGLNMTGKKEVFRLVSFYSSEGFGLTFTFVGDIRPLPDRRFIPRGSAESKSYGRLIIKGDKIVGATLINRPAEVSIIAKLIEQGTPTAGLENKLGDSGFDLKNLL